MFRVALIGFGLAGKAFHAPLISATEGLALTWIVSSRPEDVLAQYPDATVCPTIGEALADPAIDLVVIASPDHLHAAHAIAALEAGKHVVIDKPFAPTLEEAQDIADRAVACDRLLAVFHNRRWDSDFLTLQRLIAEGALGDLRIVESRFDRFRPEVTDRWKDQRAGGVWQDLGPHLVDQALQLLGMPLAVSADLATLKPGGLASDYAQVVLRYADCRVQLHMGQLLADHSLRFAVHGTGGSFVKHGLDPQEDQSKEGLSPGDPLWGIDPRPGLLTDAGGTVSPVRSERGDYGAFYRRMVAALAGNAAVPASAGEALAVMRVIAAGMASSQQRREVPIA